MDCPRRPWNPNPESNKEVRPVMRDGHDLSRVSELSLWHIVLDKSGLHSTQIAFMESL